MKYWHLNTSSSINKNHMLKLNIGMIGLEYPEEIRKHNTRDTMAQWERFKNNVSDNDEIILYHKGVGYIAHGTYKKYLDSLVLDNTNSNILSPDKNWLGAIQGHIQVDKWKLFKKPSLKNPIYKSSIRVTLTSLSKGKELFQYLLNNT